VSNYYPLRQGFNDALGYYVKRNDEYKGPNRSSVEEKKERSVPPSHTHHPFTQLEMF
jgi:hypothetical protein